MQSISHPWGEPVWSFPVPVTPHPLTDGMHVDVAIVGAGFTGLATAHYVLHRGPGHAWRCLRRGRWGQGRVDVRAAWCWRTRQLGHCPALRTASPRYTSWFAHRICQCDLQVDGCWEIGREDGRPASPIQWTDSGMLRVVNAIPGGAFDPGSFWRVWRGSAARRRTAVRADYP